VAIASRGGRQAASVKEFVDLQPDSMWSRRFRRRRGLHGAGRFEKRAQVRERLRKLVHVHVGFDTDGSKIVIYQPDEI
jgi:hypothetical protein